MTDDEITAAQALCDAATPAPWEWEDGQMVDALGRVIIETDNGVYPPVTRDAAFIAASRSLVPQLLSALSTARDANRNGERICAALVAERDAAEALASTHYREIQRLDAELREARMERDELAAWRDTAVASCARRQCSSRDTERDAALGQLDALELAAHRNRADLLDAQSETHRLQSLLRSANSADAATLRENLRINGEEYERLRTERDAMQAVVTAACAYVDAARSPANLSPTLYNEIAAPVDAYRVAMGKDLAPRPGGV